ncbi:hypothetical protein KBZ94_27315 [Streptomyces sp. RM72]|uniref:hypothetical protein n=1 Tax=Streptomyces sp. RM72 TaxID=1115510 RepID=UPI001B383A6C|nr:hypothetical protein [Streptomyces sp. RM72]MBQ0888586.1 hypothetical protein [Streptomyces sp. RM72]
MARLRTEMRAASEVSDTALLIDLRSQLQSTQDHWFALLGVPADPSASVMAELRPLKSVRERVLQTLTLIGAPASQKTIRAVNEAFFGGTPLSSARMASLRRDEERSFHSHRVVRTHVCPALLTGSFRSARSVLASSAWPLHQRLLAPGTDQVNYLTMAVNLADAAAGTAGENHGDGDAINALLASIAANIPGLPGNKPPSAARIREVAQRELDRTLPADLEDREQAARIAAQLPAADQMFGTSTSQNT